MYVQMDAGINEVLNASNARMNINMVYVHVRLNISYIHKDGFL